jgi:parallel beta-helix repeat protein
VVPCDVGVDNRAGHHHVTIKGGTIRQFGTGVFSANAENNVLKRLRISQSQQLGVIADAGSDTVIKHNVFDQNGTNGVVVLHSQRMLVKRNVVKGSRGFGVFTLDLQGSRINGNKLDMNDHGIAVFGDSRRNLVRANTVRRSRGSAIDLGQGAQNRVDLNRLADNGDGIILTDEQHTIVSDNHLTGTGLYGFPDTGGFGVILDGADANTVRHNRVVEGRGPAILVTRLDSPTGADNNAVIGNVAGNNASDGIRIGEGTSGTKVRRNLAVGNGDDGIDVDAPATIVSRNTTKRNRDLGIEAVVGPRDGGGNRAYANGNPLQCTNIECRGERR